MVPWFITWPLRKVATLPAFGILIVGTGAAVGSFQLTRTVSALALRAPTSNEPWAQLTTVDTSLAWLSAAGFSAIVVAGREILFKPTMPPYPAEWSLLAKSDSLATRLELARLQLSHQAKNYPYRFRIVTAFVAGAAGGLAYQYSIWATMRGKVRAARHEGGELPAQVEQQAASSGSGSGGSGSVSSSTSRHEGETVVFEEPVPDIAEARINHDPYDKSASR
jgi:hypothetical protein